MADDAVYCPRCGDPLEDGELDGVPVGWCNTCLGALVALNQVVPFLERLAPRLARDVRRDTTIATVRDPGPVGPCPVCRAEMSWGGFMGTERARLDHCAACQLTWLDGAEIPTVVRLYERTEQRTDDARAWHQVERDGLERRVSMGLVARAIADRITD